MQAELLQFFTQRQSGQPEPAGRLRLIALSQDDGLGEDFTFSFIQHAGMGVLEFTILRTLEQLTCECGEAVPCWHRLQITGTQGLANRICVDREPAGGEQNPAGDVFQFSHVARPRVGLQQVHGIRRYRWNFNAEVTCVFAQEMLEQKRNIVPSLPQRRDLEAHDIESVKQVFTKPPIPDHRLKIAVGGCNDPDIDGYHLSPAHPLKCLLLKHPQKFHLGPGREIPYLIKEKRRLVCLFKATNAPLGGSGE